MNIYVNIDGVLRDTIQKFDYHYKEYYLNSISEKEDNFEYGIDNVVTNVNLNQHYRFQSMDEFNYFLYVEFAIEIFGHAGLSYPTAISDFNRFVQENNDATITLIGTDTMGKSIPASLFFLAKNACIVNNIKFISRDSIDDHWKFCDIWISDDKLIIDSCPKDKRAIKFVTKYNDFFKHDFEINKLNNIDKTWLTYTEKITT